MKSKYNRQNILSKTKGNVKDKKKLSINNELKRNIIEVEDKIKQTEINVQKERMAKSDTRNSDQMEKKEY